MLFYWNFALLFSLSTPLVGLHCKIFIRFQSSQEVDSVSFCQLDDNFSGGTDSWSFSALPFLWCYSMLLFEELSVCFPQQLYHFTFLPEMWGLIFSTSFQHFFKNIFIFLIVKIYLFIFGYAGPSLLCMVFSSCDKWELLSSHNMWASHCSIFSFYRALALRHTGFISCGTWA